MSQRYTAVLTWFTGDRGYGFTVNIEGRDVFVRYTPSPTEGFRILNEGDTFEFAVIPTSRGLTAADITASR